MFRSTHNNQQFNMYPLFSVESNKFDWFFLPCDSRLSSSIMSDRRSIKCPQVINKPISDRFPAVRMFILNRTMTGQVMGQSPPALPKDPPLCEQGNSQLGRRIRCGSRHVITSDSLKRALNSLIGVLKPLWQFPIAFVSASQWWGQNSLTQSAN